MRHSTKTWGLLTTRRGGATLALAVAGLALAACGSSGSGTNGTATAASNVTGAATKDVKTRTTSQGTILVNSKGFSLYRLSGEKKGHFICTGSCTQLWHPLRPRKGKAPTGTVGHLGTVTRPDHTKQITYKGHPLYRFAQDTKPGDTKGQGFKDVGTWSVIKVSTGTTNTQTQTSTTNTGGGYPGY